MYQRKSMMYDRLATYYDALVKDEEATQAWVQWMEQRITSPATILELACGSGEITLQLANDGFEMTALDLSQSMVQQAKQKPGAEKIQFYCQNMLELDNLGSYDAIGCFCDSFNYLIMEEEVEQLFQQVHNHLKPEGLFFFDTHSLDRLQEFEEEYNETGAFEDCEYQWSIMSEENRIYQDFAFYLPDGTIHQEHHLQRVYTPEYLEQELQKYFEIESVKTDFDQEGICEGEKYFYICRKKESK